MGKHNQKIKYSSEKTWKEKHPNKKLITCPVIYNKEGEPTSAVHTLLAAVMSKGFDAEGPDYFSDECKHHKGLNCGSYWLQAYGNVSGSYLRKKGAKVRKEMEVIRGKKRKKKHSQTHYRSL